MSNYRTITKEKGLIALELLRKEVKSSYREHEDNISFCPIKKLEKLYKKFGVDETGKRTDLGLAINKEIARRSSWGYLLYY